MTRAGKVVYGWMLEQFMLEWRERGGGEEGGGGRYTEIQFCLWSTGFEFKLDIDKNM